MTMPIRDAVEIVEDYSRALSQATKKSLWQEVNRTLEEERSITGLLALGVLLKKEEDESLVPPNVFENVRRLLSRKDSPPEHRMAAARFLGNEGLREKDLSGNFRTLELLHAGMTDEGEPEPLRRECGRSLIVWGAGRLVAQAKGSAALAEYLREASRMVRVNSLAEGAVERWHERFQREAESGLRLQAALLIALNEEGIPHSHEIRGYLLRAAKDPARRGGVEERWIALALWGLEEILRKFKEEAKRAAAMGLVAEAQGKRPLAGGSSPRGPAKTRPRARGRP